MTTYSNNWQVGLPGTSGALFQSNGTNTNWQIGSQQTNAIVIKNKSGEDVLTLHNDGIIETASGKISADDWVQITMLMKQFIMDVANDPDVASKYPYIKEAAHGWLMKELAK